MTPQWPADSVERWPLSRLIPYARNARTHTQEPDQAAARQKGPFTDSLNDNANGNALTRICEKYLEGTDARS